MGEGVLRLVCDRGAAVTADELLAFERVQDLLVRAAQRAGPEDLADHRSVLEDRLLLGREPVDARRDQPLNGLGQRQVAPFVLGEHPGVLLRVERVALGALQHCLLRACVEHSPVEEALEQLGRLVVGQRADRERERVALAATPAGPAVEQLGASRPDDEEWNGRCPIREVVDEVEEPVVGPVEIFEDEHQRALLGRRLEQPPPGCEHLLPLGALRSL